MEILVDLLKVDSLDPITGYVYPSDLMQSAIKKVEERINKNDGILGEEMPPTADRSEYITLSRVSHIVKHIWIDNNTVRAKLKLLGKYREMSEAGIELHGFLRFFHSVGEDKVTADTIAIVTVDLIYKEK